MPKEPRRVPTVLGRVQNGPVTRPRGSVFLEAFSNQPSALSIQFPSEVLPHDTLSQSRTMDLNLLGRNSAASEGGFTSRSRLRGLDDVKGLKADC